MRLRLKELLEEKRMTQRELAEKTGITEQTISRYVNNQRMPMVDKACIIAMVLNESMDDLVEIEWGDRR